MGLLTGAIGSLLPKLVELLKDEYGLQKGVKQKIQSLSRELEAAHAVLRKIGDVPPEQVDELVRLWARDVREASYDMEDIVDAFLVRVAAPDEANETQMLRRLRKKVGNLFNKSKARRKISRLIQDITKKLDEVAARRGRFALDTIPIKPVAAATIDPRLVNLYKTASELIGIERPTEDLINMLSLGGEDAVFDKKMKILSIVGCGGLGKTTLAKSVYEQLKPRFECAAFVPVGQNPDMKKVLRDILIGLDKRVYTNSNMMVLDERQLIDELKEFVKEKRCLIVIDDIWDKDPWKLIRCAVEESGCGSRLIITTRIYEVATYAGDEVYKIQPLSRGNSEKLFYARIAGGVGKYFNGPSDQACERILNKCGGVPLAIITIASLLASKPSEYWSEVYSSIGFGHEENDDVDNTRKILSFGYYDLPSHLKPCLLYLSLFPEDRTILKNGLIWRWAAEGFIVISEDQEAEGVGLFELGERYFYDLINRNMIQPEEGEYTGYVDACSVHDMVLDLIRSISSNENFVTVLDGDQRQKLRGSIARRLALQNFDLHSGCQLANITVEKVRSLLADECVFGVPSSWTHLPVLRVLEMSYCYVKEDCDGGLLDSIGSLLHLRYLRAQFGSKKYITELPKEVRNLKFLQTLDLQETYGIKELLEEVGLLTQLVCLRLSLDSRTMPAGVIGKLTSLQELVIRWCDPATTAMQFVKELGSLRGLRVFYFDIRYETESVNTALLESLGNLHNIRELDIKKIVRIKTRMSHDAGFISCRHLRILGLDLFTFSVLPPWIKPSLAPNLSHLSVNLLVVKEQDMETLARLPELCSLVLSSDGDTKLVIVNIKGVAYFPKLRSLEICGTSILFNLQGSECNSSRIASIVMPCLESLEIDVHVRSLKDATHQHQLSFDKLIGFDNLGRNSLQSVTARVCCGGASARQVKEAKAALWHAAAVHPNHPTLESDLREEHLVIPTPYKEACMDMKWKKLANIVNSGHIRALCMPDAAASSSKVMSLLYIDEGDGLLALSSNAVHKLWKWEHGDKNSPFGQATTSVPPQMWQPEDGIVMENDTAANGNREETTACMELFQHDRYLLSASGGRSTLFDTDTFDEIKGYYAQPTPAATFFAAYQDGPNDIIVATGRDDSSILVTHHVHNINKTDVICMLKGHQKKITGLAFSKLVNVLVSSGADAQLCVWSMDGWEKKKSIYIKPTSNRYGASVDDTMVQFHYDETHLLVVHESQLAIYDWKLELFCSWSPGNEILAPVSSAVFSSDGLFVYAGFCDGVIGIFRAQSLTLQCMIAPYAYIPSSVSSGLVYPTVIAANPWKPYQMAVGMSDGAVYVLEPPSDAEPPQDEDRGPPEPRDGSSGSGTSQQYV